MNSNKKIWYAPNKKEAYGDLEIQAVVDCLNDGWLAGFGPRTVQFEEKVSVLFGKKYGAQRSIALFNPNNVGSPA